MRIFFTMTLVFLITVGAGCFNSQPPAAPGYQRDAEDFYRTSSAAVLRAAPAPLPVPPLAGPVPTSTAGLSPIPAESAGSAAREVIKSLEIKISKPAGIAAANLYSRTVNEYRGRGAYFQFVNCRATPGILQVKKGVTFMLDNRDPSSRTLAVGKEVYQIPPYWFALATANVVGTNYITCAGGGAAVVNVQL